MIVYPQTQVSSAIMAGCPSPGTGQTVTACSDIPQVTDLSAVDTYGDLKHDGKIDITVILVSYTDVDVLEVMAVAIAAGVLGSAAMPDNTQEVSYVWSKEEGNLMDSPHSTNQTNAPSLYQSIFSRQTEDTNGAVEVQNLEVQLTLEATHEALSCGDAGIVLSGLAALGAVIPGMGWMSFGVVGSVARFGLGVACGHGAD